MRAGLLLWYLVPLCASQLSPEAAGPPKLPLVINTWAFTSATTAAWKALKAGKSALDALEIGCSTCEAEQCDGTVGYGGSPDENGETTLEAMVMNGDTMEVGAVASLRRIKHAASVARRVMEHTGHSILAGDLATDFAKMMGFDENSLTTNKSTSIWHQWKNAHCQPNFWKDVKPNPSTSCGPYTPETPGSTIPGRMSNLFGRYNHDTIAMAVITEKGSVIVGTSTNGANHKIPGRVGDSPIPGAGAYADSDVGAALETGDGDVMLRFSPTAVVVEMMRQGIQPEMAAKKMIKRIARYFPDFSGALIAVSKDGHFGAACHNIPDYFPFSVARGESVKIVKIRCS